MEHKKIVFVVLLALVLVFSLGAAALAYDPPTGFPTDVSMPPWLSSVTVDEIPAYYQTDPNTGAIVYIRALLPVATKTEDDLRTAPVVVTTNGSKVPVLKDGATEIPYDSVVGNTYTWNSLNLVNKSYALGPSGGRHNYLAAGLETGHVLFGSNDPVRIESSSTLDGRLVNVYGSNVQNPFIGNRYFVDTSTNWTFINYFLIGTLGSSTPLSSITGVIDRAAGATVSGGGYVNSTATGFNFDFSGATKGAIKIANGNLSRTYRLMLVTEGQDIVIQQTGSDRNYDFKFDELKASAHYTGEVKTKADAIEAAWSAYIATSHIFPPGTTVMGILEDFIDWAEATNKPGTAIKYFTGNSDTGGGSYLSVLNGLSHADCGSLAGWMYTDEAYFWESPSDHANIPMVGAGDYVPAADDVIVWFYTVNYWNWF